MIGRIRPWATGKPNFSGSAAIGFDSCQLGLALAAAWWFESPLVPWRPYTGGQCAQVVTNRRLLDRAHREFSA
jgi:hypothetical protein